MYGVCQGRWEWEVRYGGQTEYLVVLDLDLDSNPKLGYPMPSRKPSHRINATDTKQTQVYHLILTHNIFTSQLPRLSVIHSHETPTTVS